MEKKKKESIKPSKEVSKKNKIEDKITIPETSERWNHIFSSKYSGCDYLTAWGNILSNNPYVQNERMKNIRTRPSIFDRQEIENAISSPESNELTLRATGAALSNSVYPFYKMMKMYSDILTYKYTCTPNYVSKVDMKKPNFRSDSKIVDMWLKKINPGYNFRRIVMDTMREGKVGYYLRQSMNTSTGKENVDSALLQKLPSDWIKITASSDNSHFVLSFNFVYFWQPGTSVYQFPPIFKKYYEQLMGCSGKTPSGYEIIYENAPKDVLVEYTGGAWYFWKELDPSECFCFSADETTSLQIPPFLGLFLTFSDIQSYVYLQQQLLSLPSYALMTGEIPMHEQNKSGNYTNDMRLSPDLILGFSEQFSGMSPMGVSPFFSPFENMQLHTFPSIPNATEITNNAIQSTIATAGLTTLLSTTEKPTVAMTKGGQLIETGYVDFLYRQFENFVNICLEKHLNLKHKWTFKMFGNRFTEQTDIQTLEKALALGQSSLLPKYLAYHDMSIEDALCNSDWMSSIGIYSKMQMVQNAFTSSTKANGRPVEQNTENDNTAKSQDSGTNVAGGREFSSNNCIHCGDTIYKDQYDSNDFCSEDCATEHLED